MPLRYLFIDMNSFFASVEQQVRPELRNQPVAVVPVRAETTCCIAASYEAKGFGIRTGTMVREARKLCPALRVVEARPRLYTMIHERLVRAVESCSPVTAVCSIDEMACRLTGEERQPDRATRLAGHIKTTLRRDLGAYLRCSIGLGPNQLLAKVAADMQKPDGLTMIRTEELPVRLHTLQLKDFPGIGPRMERRLHRSGVATVEHLCRLSASELAAIWGSRWLGQVWWGHLRGDDVPGPATRRRSLGHSRVLPPTLRNDADAWTVLVRLIEKAAARLRHVGCWAKSVSVSIKYLQGPAWSDHLRLSCCQDTLTLIRAARRLWPGKLSGIPLRVGIVLSDLTENRNVTVSLFPEDRKLQALSRAMDEINQKHGADSVYFAETHGAREQASTRIAFTRIPDLSLVDA